MELGFKSVLRLSNITFNESFRLHTTPALQVALIEVSIVHHVCASFSKDFKCLIGRLYKMLFDINIFNGVTQSREIVANTFLCLILSVEF